LRYICLGAAQLFLPLFFNVCVGLAYVDQCSHLRVMYEYACIYVISICMYAYMYVYVCI
jgi:hypothetical protein